jgi:hypothetical protein
MSAPNFHLSSRERPSMPRLLLIKRKRRHDRVVRGRRRVLGIALTQRNLQRLGETQDHVSARLWPACSDAAQMENQTSSTRRVCT